MQRPVYGIKELTGIAHFNSVFLKYGVPSIYRKREEIEGRNQRNNVGKEDRKRRKIQQERRTKRKTMRRKAEVQEAKNETTFQRASKLKLTDRYIIVIL